MKKNLKIAITGGIGSGKSLVTGYIEKLGYPVIKSDDVAKELMRSDESIKKKIIKEFGPPAYNENGLNTKYLAELVFTYPEKVQKINSIVHPPTTKKISDLADQLFTKHKIVFVESALIYEAKIQNQFDYIVLIYSDEQTRIKRVIQREKITHGDIQKRMAFQIPDDQKKERADFVIENNSSITELQNRTNFILNILKSFVE
jgi:dephospho-CoA kinase